jgi:hypothetical protein
LTRGPIGYPDRVKTTLLYGDTLVISGSASQYTFRANSLFDPDFTSTGHQPFYYDQYISVYEKYRVYAAKICIRVLNSASTPSTVVCIPASQIPTITSLNQAMESPRAVYTAPLETNNLRHQDIQVSASTREILGLTPPQLYDADFAATFSSNPVELWYYALYFAPNTTGGSLNLVVQIRIEFQCEFFDRAPVALSFAQVSALRKSQSVKREMLSSELHSPSDLTKAQYIPKY